MTWKVQVIKTDAAPVQMPEPDAWRYTTVRGHFRYRGRRVGFAAEYPMLKPEPLYTEQQVRALLAATQPTAQGLEADLTDAQIDEAFNQMPDGAAGFLKSWGYRQFARAVLAAQAKQGGQANG